MKLRIILPTLFLFSLSAQAGRRSTEAMQAIAEQVLHRHQARGTALSVRQLQETEAYAVFGHENEGFVIVSVNDEMPAVLAYSDHAFDDQTDNPGYLWWSESIQQVARSYRASDPMPPDTSKYPAEVAPLLHSSWGSYTPYNLMCPMRKPSPWTGYDPSGVHCHVGCVAVAMGQIMRYYQWPVHGTGVNSVKYPHLSSDSHTFTVDFSEATYDWENMLDEYPYTDVFSDVQKKAVAELLYHCAIATGMFFEKAFSFSTNFWATDAMNKHFFYEDGGIKQRTVHSLGTWMEMVYKELSEKRPIFYEAISTKIFSVYAHSFVIDGYDQDGLVHVNWGWMGKMNGYYNISLLNPDDYKFTSYQDMIIGLQPAKDATAMSSPKVSVIENADVYSIDGRLVQKHAETLDNLPPGLYIWKGKVISRSTISPN